MCMRIREQGILIGIPISIGLFWSLFFLFEKVSVSLIIYEVNYI
jgi:hypothetical protein